MKLRKNKFFKKISAIFLILLGVIGSIFPFVPGFVFFIAGLSLLSVDFANNIKKSKSRYRCHKNIFKFTGEIIEYSVVKLREFFAKKNYKGNIY